MTRRGIQYQVGTKTEPLTTVRVDQEISSAVSIWYIQNLCNGQLDSVGVEDKAVGKVIASAQPVTEVSITPPFRLPHLQ